MRDSGFDSSGEPGKRSWDGQSSGRFRETIGFGYGGLLNIIHTCKYNTVGYSLAGDEINWDCSDPPKNSPDPGAFSKHDGRCWRFCEYNIQPQNDQNQKFHVMLSYLSLGVFAYFLSPARVCTWRKNVFPLKGFSRFLKLSNEALITSTWGVLYLTWPGDTSYLSSASPYQASSKVLAPSLTGRCVPSRARDDTLPWP